MLPQSWWSRCPMVLPLNLSRPARLAQRSAGLAYCFTDSRKSVKLVRVAPDG